METILSSADHQVVIGHSHPTVLIGERINPTGKSKLAAALANRDWPAVQREATDQIAAGADVLDVNVGVSDQDQVILLPQVIKLLMDTVTAPLCLDSDDARAIEAGLRIYRGKALVNSVRGDQASMDTILPLVKEYGAAVIGLTMDENGIPSRSDQRIAIAHKIVERAVRMGIEPENVIIDCLALPIATDSSTALITLSAIQGVHSQLGVNQTIGASNVSFGLPSRGILTGEFLGLALQMGVTCPVVDAAQVRPAVLAADVLLGRDEYALRFIRAHRQREKTLHADSVKR